MSAAPLYTDLADGPSGGHAVWLTAADGVKLRAAIWPLEDAKATVFLLPGRTEYVEKYGRAAADLAQRGYATLSIDWRGQGMSDRASDDAMLGHVDNFSEYQLDIEAMLLCARDQGLPEPYVMLAHSMGAAIGLRALTSGFPVKAVAFTGPMWGILIAAWMRPIAQILTATSRLFKFDHRYAPTTGARAYVLEVPFSGNTLTTDAEMWDYMRRQALAHPELSLGGPSLGWMKAALSECHALSLLPSPSCPAYCGLGGVEKIVDVGPIHARMATWPNGSLDLFDGAEHEILMEVPAIRTRFFDRATALFDQNL